MIMCNIWLWCLWPSLTPHRRGFIYSGFHWHGQPSGEEAVKLAMPGINGIEAAGQIKEACPAIAILMVSAYDYESYLVGSLRAGSAGYMLKNAPVGEIISAVRLVCS